MKSIKLLVALCATAWAWAQPPVTEPLTLDYYLPKNTTYNPNIPTPKQIIGHEVGEWHVTHDKLVQYAAAVAALSDRVHLENRGVTYEGRPLLLLTITSPENYKNLAKIKAEHMALTEPGAASLDTQKMPLVLYQGFSIHGNEASGSNAGLAYLYYLAAAQGPEIEKALSQTVILMDPSFNPDGLQRFAYWANTNKSNNLNPDPNEREYHEVWPGGRTNHYWFDLNRDWLPTQLPESQARLVTFHQWLPNILTDHHEMGTNSTFFFQPGEPKRVHPLTPKLNQELTAEIGTYHAKAFDQIGSLYYSEENYDDYYYGKGSTFPDLNGSVGILFEQGSSRGHVQESDNGLLTFAFTVRNQMTAALSTLEAAQAMRVKMLNYQRDFYAQSWAMARAEKTNAWVIGQEKDVAKTTEMVRMMQRQKIDVHPLKQDITAGGTTYKSGSSFLVPLNQKNNRLIQAMFERRLQFTDSLFYDISAWTYPLAYGGPHAKTTTAAAGPVLAPVDHQTGGVRGTGKYAYVFEWHEYYTPKLLQELLSQGIRAKVAMKPFTLEGKKYDYGTIMIPTQNQTVDAVSMHQAIDRAAQSAHVFVDAVGTGLSLGIDLGSNNFEPLTHQKVGMFVGQGVAASDAGEIWHLFDQRYDITLTKIDLAYASRTDLSRYTTLILPSTYGNAIDKATLENLKEWVQEGGKLIGYKNAVTWMERNGLLKAEFVQPEMTAKNIAFDQKENFYGAQETGGAIFEAKVDLSHPINFGYTQNKLALFRDTNIYMKADADSFNNPIQYTQSPLISGYHSKINAKLIPNTVPFKVQRMGSGRVIAFTDNTNFRAFWYGTNKLLANALFFGHSM